MSEDAIHLGDGAYVSRTPWGDILITGNHHERDKATDVVSIDERSIKRLIQFLEDAPKVEK